VSAGPVVSSAMVVLLFSMASSGHAEAAPAPSRKRRVVREAAVVAEGARP
jgi:hypothetical protein